MNIFETISVNKKQSKFSVLLKKFESGFKKKKQFKNLQNYSKVALIMSFETFKMKIDNIVILIRLDKNVILNR